MYGGEVDVCRQNGDSRDEQLLKKGLMMAEDKPVVELSLIHISEPTRP